MSGLISRLKEIIEKYNAGCYNETCNPFDSCTDCVLKQIREVIESQPPADQWIPCSERPPKEPCIYTVEDWSPYTVNKHGEPQRRVIVLKPLTWEPYHRVIAWKPINIEPYKGE